MIRSMTGFAQAERMIEGASAAVVIRTYNSKSLDLSVKIYGGPSELEEKIRAFVSSRISRGRVELKVNINESSEDVKNYEVDILRAKAYYKALTGIRDELGIKEAVALENVLSGGGIIRFQETYLPVERYWVPLEEALGSAIKELMEMRKREGDNLQADLKARIDFIDASIDKIEARSSELPEIYRVKLVERIKNLTKGIIELDNDRIIQEAAFMADKIDISEEIVRARSHVVLFLETMYGPEPAGRKMNFLVQEFGREFNTIGSKTSSTEISHLVVELKSELEKLREQIQNVE